MIAAVSDPARIVRFAIIGLLATALYGVLVLWGAARLQLPTAVASLLAYAIAGTFSYFAHRWITFRSRLPHRRTSPRFAAVALSGNALALLAPLLLTDAAGLPAPVAVAFVSLAVPMLNFVLMQRLVFRSGSAPSLDGGIR